MNEQKAAEYFRRGAEAGDPEGQYNFGICLRDGKGVPQDTPEAIKWLRKAADTGHPEAGRALSQLQNTQPASPQTSTTSHPEQPSSTQAKNSEGAGMGCAVVAAIVGLIVFANSCTITIPGGFFTPDTHETNWPAALLGTAIVTAIAYGVGKNAK